MIYNNTVYDLSVAVLFVLLVTRPTQVLTSEIEIRVQNLILIARWNGLLFESIWGSSEKQTNA